MTLLAWARIRLDHPERVLDTLAAHFGEHGAVLASVGGRHEAVFPFGTGRFWIGDGAVELRAEASNLADLHEMRMTLAAHIREFGGHPRPEIVWAGDGSTSAVPADFRELRVVRARHVTPHMRRLTFAGADLGRYGSDTNLHVRLLLPTARSAEPQWPTLGPDGLLRWPEGNRLASRRYTVRRCDAGTGELDIDFVLHAEAGPGSSFAAGATAGDRAGILGPGGGGVPRGRDWYLLAGDETALPAIARIVAALPRDARGLALVEVASPAECQDLDMPAGFAVRWIHRSRAGAGTLAGEIMAALAGQDQRAFVWVGSEFSCFGAVRERLRAWRGAAPASQLVVPYWRSGWREDQLR